jgi:hypothetical protein
MGVQRTLRTFDRTPEPFRTRGDLPGIGDGPVGITTVDAIELLDRVQLRQMIAVDHEIVSTAQPRNAVNAETQILIQGDRQIENNQRDDHTVDNRC